MKEQEFYKLKNRVEKLEKALVNMYNHSNDFERSVSLILPELPGYDEAVNAVKEKQEKAKKEIDEKAKELMVDAEEVKPESKLIIED